MTPEDLGYPTDGDFKWELRHDGSVSRVTCTICGEKDRPSFGSGASYAEERAIEWATQHRAPRPGSTLSPCHVEWLNREWNVGHVACLDVIAPAAIALVGANLAVAGLQQIWFEPWVLRAIARDDVHIPTLGVWVHETPERIHAIRALSAVGRDPMILWERSRHAERIRGSGEG